MRKEKVIYQSSSFYSNKEMEEMKKELQTNRIDDGDELLSDEKLEEYIRDDIDNLFWEDEKDNLDKELDNKILVIASLGLWNGRRSGYKIIGNNLNEIISSFSCDSIKIYTDGYDIKFVGHHHDGTNRYTFRLIKNMDNIENLTNKIYNGEYISRSILNYYTKSLYPEVKNIYGW